MNFIQDYNIILNCFNHIELVLGLLCFLNLSLFRMVMKRLVSIFFGMIFGTVVGLLVWGNPLCGMLCGMLCGILLYVVSKVYKKGNILIIFTIVSVKFIFAFATFFLDEYSIQQFLGVLILSIILAIIAAVLVCEKKGNIISEKLYILLGAFEISANMIAIFKFDLLSLNKFLYDKNQITVLLLYILKIDFTIQNYQELYFLLVIIFLVIRIIGAFITRGFYYLKDRKVSGLR